MVSARRCVMMLMLVASTPISSRDSTAARAFSLPAATCSATSVRRRTGPTMLRRNKNAMAMLTMTASSPPATVCRRAPARLLRARARSVCNCACWCSVIFLSRPSRTSACGTTSVRYRYKSSYACSLLRMLTICSASSENSARDRLMASRRACCSAVSRWRLPNSVFQIVALVASCGP